MSEHWDECLKQRSWFVLFVDQQFPIEIGSVQSDHDFLDQDSIQSLFRSVTHASQSSV